MSLNSFSFVLFMPFIVVIHFSLPRKARYIWLFFVNLFFYLSNDIRYIGGLLFCTATTYAAGLLLGKVKKNAGKVLAGLCILANVLSLLFYRQSFVSPGFTPVGISFYTLQAMGYVIDVYRGQLAAEKNPFRYAVFVSFFPTVLSGPIQRGNGLLRQLREGRDFDYAKARSGLYCLMWGYFLKIVMADSLAPMVTFAYDSYRSVPGAALLWATVLYAVQLYCDFSGYSALAVGAGRLLGFDLGANFAQPYFASSIKDFWNRWHISLSSWLRDYVYIPLGGNRKGKGRRYFNLMATFLVSGLWHGSGIQFIVWGLLHGSYQILGSLAVGRQRKRTGPVLRVAGMIATFLLVDFAWLFFRSDSLEQALGILHQIFFAFGFREMTYYGYYLLGGTRFNLIFVLAGVAIVFFVDFLHERRIYIEETAGRRVNGVLRWIFYILLTLFLLLTVVRNYGETASAFIYEKF